MKIGQNSYVDFVLWPIFEGVSFFPLQSIEIFKIDSALCNVEPISASVHEKNPSHSHANIATSNLNLVIIFLLQRIVWKSISVHERKELFECELCEYSFSLWNIMKIHIKSVHEENVIFETRFYLWAAIGNIVLLHFTKKNPKRIGILRVNHYFEIFL